MRPPRRTIVRTAAAIALAGGLLASSAAAAVPTTLRASLSGAGAELVAGTSGSFDARASISADGRWATFESGAPTVVPGDTNGVVDIFQRDLRSGAVRRLSQRADGVQANGGSRQHAASADGRIVVFETAASNLAGGTANSADDVYVWNRDDGSLRRVSTSLTGGDGDDWSRDPRVSADGTAISFAAVAGDLVPGDTGFVDVFVADTATLTLRRVTTQAGTALTANGNSDGADVSDGGRFVSFASGASNLVAGDNNTVADVFVRDLQTGAVERVSASASGGEGDGASNRSAITPDGCVVAFNSAATNLVAGSGPASDTRTLVRTRCGTPNTEVVSRGNSGTIFAVGQYAPDVSADGCAVTFLTNLAVVGAAPAGVGVFLRDRCEGVTSRIDLSTTGEAANNGAGQAFISGGTGRYVAFSSSATNLVAGDGNGALDVFVRDRGIAVPPVADLRLHVEGRRVVADASASADPDNGIASARIAFGDGTAEVDGLNATHDYARDGAFTVTLTVTDRDGLTATTSKPVSVAAITGVDPGAGPGAGGGFGGGGPGTGGLVALRKFALTGGVLSRSRFKAVRKGGRVDARRGATLRLAVTEAATLTLRFDRAVRGRRKGKACTPTATRGRPCTLYRAAGAATVALKAGTGVVGLTGRVGSRALPAGRYRLRASAKAGDGRSSSVLTRTITIAKG